MDAASKYGALKDVVSTAGAAMSAGGAILFAFKGRARWEPAEQDVPSLAQKVGGLVASVLIVLMYVAWRGEDDIDKLETTAIVMVLFTVLFAILYSWLVGVRTYDKVIDSAGNKQRVIGGLWLTAEAKKVKADRGVTTQVLFEGAAYDVDELWSPTSRQSAKTLFQLGYIGLTVCGTLALAAAAIRLGLAVG